MILNKLEFYGMNNPIRRFFQKQVEYRWLKRMTPLEKNERILEIGCGSGYGATLLSQLEPASYVGIDLMPEQISLAKKRRLPGYQFIQMDATDLSYFEDTSKDLIVVFGILHHIPQWRKVLNECHRVLRVGGKLYLEEIDGRLVRFFDTVLRTRHPKEAAFSMAEFEEHLVGCGFNIAESRYLPYIGIYSATKN